MNDLEAIMQLKAGEKIRLSNWRYSSYIYYDSSNRSFKSNLNDTYDFLFQLGRNYDWQIYNPMQFKDLKCGDKFRFTETGPIMQKVAVSGGKQGYLHTEEFWVAEVTINSTSSVIKV